MADTKVITIVLVELKVAPNIRASEEFVQTIHCASTNRYI